MYCPSCGKQIPDQSRFCYVCGAAVQIQVQPQPAAAPPAPTEWEYCYYVQWWDVNKGGRYYMNTKTEMSIRMENWAQDQLNINSQLQKYYDEGWTAITEVGPNAYTFRPRSDSNNRWLEARDFRVKFRRPKRQDKPAPLVALLGKWEAVEILKHGAMASLLVGVVSALGNHGVGNVYKFYDDYSYEEFSKDGKKVDWGIFDFFNQNQKFVILTDKTDKIVIMPVLQSDITGSNEFILHTMNKGVEIVYRKI